MERERKIQPVVIRPLLWMDAFVNVPAIQRKAVAAFYGFP